MSSEYCQFCFQTIYGGEERIVRCTSCGKVYHEPHFDNACSCCSGKGIEAHTPVSGTITRAIIRKPIKLKRRVLDDIVWGLKEYIAWGNSHLRAYVNVILGIIVATIIGAYTYRLLSFQTYSEPVEYFNNLIRDGFPPQLQFLFSLIASVLGAFVFFSFLRPNESTEDTFNQRFGRLLASLILLVSMNIVLFEFDANDVSKMIKSEIQISFGEFGLSLFTAQGGALFITMVAGFVIRSRNSSAYQWELPKKLSRSLKVVNVLRFYVVSLSTATLAFLFSLNLLPSYRFPFDLLKLSEWTAQTNSVELTVLNATIIISLLLYLPPNHSNAVRKWWFIRLIGCGVAMANIFSNYRSASVAQLESIVQAALIAVIVTFFFIPIQRALS